MAKYYGMIGYGVLEETVPGVWEINIIEKPAIGDVLRNYNTWQTGDSKNDDIKISNQISIIGDPYAFSNFHTIRYLTWMGVKWKVTSVDVRYPRLILNIGGEYNNAE